MRIQTLLAMLICAAVLGCSRPSVTSEDEISRDPASLRSDAPWELTNDLGEMILPDIFYAEESQNEQLMDLAIGNGKRRGHMQIDRLIYPTLGNPKLFVRDRDRDSVLFVMRIEGRFLEHLQPKLAKAVRAGRANRLELTEDARNQLVFYVIPRDLRMDTTASEASIANTDVGRSFRITPSSILMHSQSADMPEVLKKRQTLEVSFNKQAMARIGAGLYDIRFEVWKDGQLLRNAGGSPVMEYQYNALRVFERAESGKYTIVNITDTQVSASKAYKDVSSEPLKMFVESVNRSQDPKVKNAAFIMFNGDLHDGGSPEERLPRFVAGEYNREAKITLDILKELRFPIFLTPGNHDGYTSVGLSTIPRWEKNVAQHFWGGGDVIEQIEQANGTWPVEFNADQYTRWSQSLQDPAGQHVDIFTGRFVRKSGRAWDAWQELPLSRRNYVLYDGFYQWQKTYGPLYYSYSFGQNYFVNMNTYEVRQHRRSGWGMYTLNYGGGISRPQMDWIQRELERSRTRGKDVVLIGHHDPRGGHNGVDYPYYFPLEGYDGGWLSDGKSASRFNYVHGEMINSKLCKTESWGWSLVKSGWDAFYKTIGKKEWAELSCLHDGLQEWMRPDKEFDCDEQFKDANGYCSIEKSRVSGSKEADAGHLWYSGYALIDLINRHAHARTLLLGHTHWNSYQVLKAGEELVPRTIDLGYDTLKKYAKLESHRSGLLTAENTTDEEKMRLYEKYGFVATLKYFALDLEKAGHKVSRVIGGDPSRELVILRMTSGAEMSSQKFQGKPMYGFTVFGVEPKNDSRNYLLPQINEISYYRNIYPKKFLKAFRREKFDRAFEHAFTFDVIRTESMAPGAPENPVSKVMPIGN